MRGTIKYVSELPKSILDRLTWWYCMLATSIAQSSDKHRVSALRVRCSCFPYSWKCGKRSS
ncbi:hypothetical protein N9O24_01115, partial [bacterium]|nr:hypothetical protein [bacterium]